MDDINFEIKTGIDPEVLKIIHPTPFQRFVARIRRYVSHILYRLHLKKV